MGRVLISAGHTVMDPGAIFKDLREADLTRKIAPKIIPHLKKAGVEVQGVPLDLPLWQRLEWINNTGYSEAKGDVLIEIHVNDSDGSKRGIEAWYKGSGDNESQKLAHAVVKTLEREGYESQGIKSEFQHELGVLTFLNRPNPTPLLLETLYMDNEEDAKLLKNDKEIDKLAKTVAKGILYYLGKDSKGKNLPKDKLPKYDNLKAYEGENEDSGDLFQNLPFKMPSKTSQPQPPTSTPSVPKPSFSPPAPSGLGGFGGGGFGGGGFGGSSMMADREQRKKMIESNYLKILGRKPTPNDLNYFLNMGINETDLVKKMAESQEHADLIKAKKELEEVKAELDKTKSEVTKLRSEIRDKQNLVSQLSKSVGHKNSSIKNLEQMLATKLGMPSDVAAKKTTLTPTEAQKFKPNPKQDKALKQKFFKYLSSKVA